MSVDITKTAAAQRQIDAAIRMMFSGEDSLAVHTVVAAALGIVRDLTKKRGEVSRLEDSLNAFFHKWRPQLHKWEGPSEFTRFVVGNLNRSANFLKHADRDHGNSLDEMKMETDTLLLVSCVAYNDLGLSLTTEMRAYCRWHLAIYPHEEGDSIQTAVGPAYQLPRHHQLEFGNYLLELHQRHLFGS